MKSALWVEALICPHPLTWPVLSVSWEVGRSGKYVPFISETKEAHHV
jgi:hypothetical protein